MVNNNISRKTLLAVLFSAGLLNSQLNAWCADRAESSEPLIVEFATNLKGSPETRAYIFLRLANSYAAITDRALAEAPHRAAPRWTPQSKEWRSLLLEMVKDASQTQLAAIVDRLPSSSHERRKVHRDLVLWYDELGKSESADKQKQILFDLVGVKNDKLLYPVFAGYGREIWWQVSTMAGGFCDMG